MIPGRGFPRLVPASQTLEELQDFRSRARARDYREELLGALLEGHELPAPVIGSPYRMEVLVLKGSAVGRTETTAPGPFRPGPFRLVSSPTA